MSRRYLVPMLAFSVFAVLVIWLAVHSQLGVHSGALPTATATPTTRAPSPATEEQVCPSAPGPGRAVPAARPYDPTGARYAGPAPHPIAVIQRQVRHDGKKVSANGIYSDQFAGPVGFGVPARWASASRTTASSPAHRTPNRSRTQLVACVYYAKVAANGPTCSYLGYMPAGVTPQQGGGSGDIRMLSASYLVVVREARTARTVASFELSSADAYTVNDTGRYDPPGCPDTINLSQDGTDEILPPLNRRFVHRLRPLVER